MRSWQFAKWGGAQMWNGGGGRHPMAPLGYGPGSYTSEIQFHVQQKCSPHCVGSVNSRVYYNDPWRKNWKKNFSLVWFVSHWNGGCGVCVCGGGGARVRACVSVCVSVWRRGDTTSLGSSPNRTRNSGARRTLCQQSIKGIVWFVVVMR